MCDYTDMLCQVLLELTEPTGCKVAVEGEWIFKVVQRLCWMQVQQKSTHSFCFYNNFLLFHTHCSPHIEQYSVSLEVPVVMLFVKQRFVWNFSSNISAVGIHYFWQHWLPANLPSCFSNWSYSNPWQKLAEGFQKGCGWYKLFFLRGIMSE